MIEALLDRPSFFPEEKNSEFFVGSSSTDRWRQSVMVSSLNSQLSTVPPGAEPYLRKQQSIVLWVQGIWETLFVPKVLVWLCQGTWRLHHLTKTIEWKFLQKSSHRPKSILKCQAKISTFSESELGEKVGQKKKKKWDPQWGHVE